ncbi:MAG: UDP-4-amino-4,6-dideoxy-N-acetyl-beta-L-altrosamine N-acetyltransferase [bacterium]|nr:UDP-4-amino-4,6-dideoxy-N-acetyl-beta-L-altrosamine N-acetyltransferase [bacterium]MCM1374900.1 UDP-4-amino-4,6-dideoxy-N-acetyl-beta-L-altrosamine N-acetyltransferase [Muribaculum sp.]
MCVYGEPGAAIYLRPMTYEDTDLIVSWRNQEAVRRNFIYQELFTRESHEQWIHTMVETGKVVQMVICETEGGRPVGSVYLRDIDRRHNKAEYGIFIGGEGARGKGYGTVAARLMIRYAFEELGLHRLFLRAFADNEQAIRSYEKAGFEREAYLREDVCIEERYRDIVLMGVLNREHRLL